MSTAITGQKHGITMTMAALSKRSRHSCKAISTTQYSTNCKLITRRGAMGSVRTANKMMAQAYTSP